jgi:hypothetical protein
MSTPAPTRSRSNAISQGTREAELVNSRLGVIYFLGNLQVDFSPEKSVTDMKNTALGFVQGKVGDGRILQAATKVGNVVGAADSMVNDICKSVGEWLANKFHVPASDVDLAIQHIRYNLPGLIYTIQDEVRKTAGDFGVTGMASGLYKGVTEAIKLYNIHTQGQEVSLVDGHPDIIAISIRNSVRNSLLEGLGAAALAGAKAALAAFTGGVGLIINKLAGVIEAILRFAVRFCDGLALRRIFADCKQRWAIRGQASPIQARASDFAEWFRKIIDRAPIVAALVMNCGIAGDALRFLTITVDEEGMVLTQGQFDKGVNFLNTLKGAASDLIMEIQESMRISSTDKITAALLKHAGEIGLVHKEAGSSWRARLFGWSNQRGNASQGLNWVLDKAGYKQSTIHTRI